MLPFVHDRPVSRLHAEVVDAEQMLIRLHGTPVNCAHSPAQALWQGWRACKKGALPIILGEPCSARGMTGCSQHTGAHAPMCTGTCPCCSYMDHDLCAQLMRSSCAASTWDALLLQVLKCNQGADSGSQTSRSDLFSLLTKRIDGVSDPVAIVLSRHVGAGSALLEP